MTQATEGTLLWEPPAGLTENANITRYARWLADEKGVSFGGYADLWGWSVENPEGFWGSLWEFCGVISSGDHQTVLKNRKMPGAEWFPGAEINYAEHALRAADGRPDAPALVHKSETRPLAETSWRGLRGAVGALAAGLRGMGVGRGDRVVAYAPNVPEAVVAFLACASVGAVWSSCSPDFGAGSVIDRFAQIRPKVLFAVDGYRYGGKDFDRTAVVGELREKIPSLETTVLIPYLNRGAGPPDVLGDVVLWGDLLARNEGAEPSHERVPFDHPLWVLYSSGTTGLPKAIVHSQGGILLEHLKLNVLQHDLGPEDRFFWFTTTGWMMWNTLVSALLAGSTAVLYDGSPGHPDMNALWAFAEDVGVTHFGTSASYLTGCAKAGVEPGRDFDLSKLKGVGSTGSPLPPEGFAWAYEHVKRDLWLYSMSGGTDLCTAFIGGTPLAPVRAGELQARALGASVEAYSEDGEPVLDEVGELVITRPMPSMPVYLWNDPDGERYRESYFDVYPGVWRHGDWIQVKTGGGCVIYGRSDSTINRGGVRMGTSEIYAAVEEVEEVADSLVVDVHNGSGESVMPLFVVLAEGAELDDDLKKRIKASIRERTSPRHVPDEIFAVPDVPRTLNGKKLEVPAKKVLTGTPPGEAASRDSLANPEALDRLAGLAENM